MSDDMFAERRRKVRILHGALQSSVYMIESTRSQSQSSHSLCWCSASFNVLPHASCKSKITDNCKILTWWTRKKQTWGICNVSATYGMGMSAHISTCVARVKGEVHRDQQDSPAGTYCTKWIWVKIHPVDVEIFHCICNLFLTHRDCPNQ